MSIISVVVVVVLLSRGNIQISWQTIRKLKLYQNWTSYAIRKELWVKRMLDKQNLNLKIMIALVSNNNDITRQMICPVVLQNN